jgi:hypothetical protein
MFKPIHHKTATLPLPNSISRAPWRRGFLLIALALAGFALSPMTRAQLPPPAPDGGYPNQNTAEGDHALFSLTTGMDNTAIGSFALSSNTTGGANTATGFDALASNTTGSNNTGNGFRALFSNTSGGSNTGTGVEALFNNTTGTQNTATGVEALGSNTTGSQNTATGINALLSNTTGSNNTGNGANTLLNNTTGSQNMASGANALFINTTGSGNTATGAFTLVQNTTGSDNTATGINALLGNTTGNDNTANGAGALFANTTGGSNTATGAGALVFNTTGGSNTANGATALLHNTTGSNNIALGSNAGINLTTGSNNIDIGARGVAGESNTIRIGAVGLQKTAYMQGISGATVASGVTVIVGSNGHLGTVTSSARFKEAIKPMDKASEAILALKPVTFRYKHELDPQGIPQFGLVAEQVEKVNPDLVVRDADGKLNTVRYEAVNAMLLNEFLKEHRTVQEQKATIAQLRQDLQSRLAEQQKQIEALTAGLQKVSAQLELNKPAPQIVADNQ